jgi:hypothetical protein
MEEAAVEKPDDLYLSDWSQPFVLTDIDHNVYCWLSGRRAGSIIIYSRHTFGHIVSLEQGATLRVLSNQSFSILSAHFNRAKPSNV